jgi:hypothetical protein
MLQITDLTFNAWGRKFLEDASVSLPPGAKVGLVGRGRAVFIIGHGGLRDKQSTRRSLREAIAGTSVTGLSPASGQFQFTSL